MHNKAQLDESDSSFARNLSSDISREDFFKAIHFPAPTFDATLRKPRNLFVERRTVYFPVTAVHRSGDQISYNHITGRGGEIRPLGAISMLHAAFESLKTESG
ncbi:hypothetical protein Hypma_003565 [Hypsizygus marmoreus]|uniref:Uncharacterized protein n=1 Tax=Hypsizygus marmoreus TaxID=39966 RepID=A0A369J1N3_HYPMA|nr:hypothetical protein Hypma_003565 [Hypsizygus marmoreus]